MFFKTIALVPLFYLFAILQASFLAHFSLFGITPNLIFILVIILIFFSSRWQDLGIIGAFAGGFFLDIFSGSFLGFNVLTLLGTALFTKLIFKKYVQIPFV